MTFKSENHTSSVILIYMQSLKMKLGVPVVAQWVKNLTKCEDAALIPGLTEWVKELALPQGAT